MSQLDKMVFWYNNSTSEDSEDKRLIDTRFGSVSVQANNVISFPRGLLGMPEKRSFYLTEFPNRKLDKFKLLQSAEDKALSFITLPVDMQNGIIDAQDIESACAELGILSQNLAVLLVVSVHRSLSTVSLSVNARAPLLIDSSLHLAAQYVFHTEKYLVQHYITA